MSARFLGALLLALAIWSSSCLLAQAADSEETKGTSTSKTNELLAPYLAEQALAPEWYKKRYKVFPNGKVVNKLEDNILYLGLILYPVLFLIIGIVVGRNEHSFAIGFFATVAGPVLAYFGIIIITYIINRFSNVVLGLFWDTDSYVPWDFADFILHAFLQCGLLILCLTMFANWIAGRPTGINSDYLPLPGRQTHSPTRLVFASMLKAAIVTILTGVATTLGGWVAGGIIFVICTGISSAFGINLADAQGRTHY